MLVDFTVENYRSIKEPVTLSAIATKRGSRQPADADLAPAHKIEGWDMELLPVLALYGANASGKSNVLNALDDFLFLSSHSEGTRSPDFNSIIPFWFDTAWRSHPTCFTLRIAAEAILYTYRLEIDRDRILLERLDYAPSSSKRNRSLFIRVWDYSANRYTFHKGKDFPAHFYKLLESLSSNEPALSLFARLDTPILNPLLKWIHRTPVLLPDNEETIRNATNWFGYTKPDRLRNVSNLMQLFDFGVERIEIEKIDIDQQETLEQKFLLFSHHRTEDGTLRVPFSWESLGTQKMFLLLFPADHILREGGMMVADEFDSSLHPQMVRQFVKLFQNPETNPKGAQLIFTTHDITLMRNLLRRDQIWFTEKRPDGSTDLFPLTDFKVREDASIDRWYLDGMFGAVPILPLPEEVESVLGGKE